jgi:hypothetical protein
MAFATACTVISPAPGYHSLSLPRPRYPAPPEVEHFDPVVSQ